MPDIEKKDKSIAKPSKGGPDFSMMRRRKGPTGSVNSLIKSIRDQGGKLPSLQVLMMFDITRSMFSYFDLVRKKMTEIITTVKKESRNSEFAVFAYRNHGDECRYPQIYYTSLLTGNMEEVTRNISVIQRGGGGLDALTCMEDCLWEANTLSWNPKSPKALVVIGDMPPHGVVDSKHKCPREIDYKDEVGSLKSKGIKVYSVYCPHNKEKVREFYMWLANTTGGKFLEITEIDILVELLIGICMKETGKLDKYIGDLKNRQQLTGNTQRALKMLTEGR